jgi:N-acetyl-gamma-glutamyl-phosphate reductase
VHFVPWRGDFTRGIFVSSTISTDLSLETIQTLYKEFYQDHPFAIMADKPVALKQVVNTNKCVIFIEQEGNKIVVHSAIDNLLKGASGQAVQNMNILFGLDQTSGLNLKAAAF